MSLASRVAALEKLHNPKVVLFAIKGGLPDVLPPGVNVERPGMVEMKIGKRRYFMDGGLPDLAGDPRPLKPSAAE